MVRNAAFAAAMALGLMVGQETVTYTYDVHGRLIQLSRAGGPNAGSVTTYGFDANTNRTSRVTTGAGSLMAADAMTATSADTAEAAPGVTAPEGVHLDIDTPDAAPEAASSDVQPTASEADQ